ncbi:MAG: hypothetical protein L6Q92_16275 [Phycisphaerae bacterium]|nr:hypothetical protein [Phycisphaerae bacterium]
MFRLNPQQVGRAGRGAFKARGNALPDVGEAVALVDHLHADGADAIDHRPHGAAGCRGLQQDGEAALVPAPRHHAAQGHAVLEGVEVGGRLDDRAFDAQDLEAVADRAALVADQDDAGLAKVALALACGAALPLLKVPRRIDEGVERLGGDLQRFAWLDFGE